MNAQQQGSSPANAAVGTMSNLAVNDVDVASISHTVTNTNGADRRTSDRWRLNRAGIINVYQYENEVLDFAGGRLLLRGVNGSGKSTAMNMLLPFLLTARPGRIDAAGEQTGILKSWMLSGRDDAQPVGYLWIEFQRRGEFVVCGCGIKANRQSDTVSTWWFITSKRPGVDVHLVVGDQPLSADALRAELDGDEVFGDRRRSDYRRAVQQRLFGGAPIDQHIGLIHVVRSPRVGDRIDIELPEHLVEALPQLSEQALAEAAQPLDDLEEHRRNVGDLERTSEAIGSLLDVYRSYCASEIRQRAAEGRSRLTAERSHARDEYQKRRAAEAAETEVARLDEELAEHERIADRLRSEISALEESHAYREGQQLDALRDFVANLARQRESAATRVAGREESVEVTTGELLRARDRSRDDTAALNVGLAAAAGLGEHCRVAWRPPGPVELAETSLVDVDASVPADSFNDSMIEGEIAAMGGAVLRRQADVNQVDEALTALDAAISTLSDAESSFRAASEAADRCSVRLAEQDQKLATARREWHDEIRQWALEARFPMREAGLDGVVRPILDAAAPDVSAPASVTSDAAKATPGSGASTVETLRLKLSSVCDELIGHWREAAATVEFRLRGERTAAEEAQALVDALADRIEPEPPRLSWQTAAEYCLADLIDFKTHLDDAERSGIEAALESSGLLSARLVEGALELAGGDLVAAMARPVASPLSDCLDVTVPDRLSDRVDAPSVARLLASVSSDTSTDAATAAAADGSFRVGALSGRHCKDRAEFIGATARREALDRERREASVLLDAALAVVHDSEAELAQHRSSLEQAQRLGQRLPSTAAILKATAAASAAAHAAEAAQADRSTAAADREEAERASIAASNELHRIAVTLQLPRDRHGLEVVRVELRDLASDLEKCRSLLQALTRSIDDWRRAAIRWQAAADDLRAERGALSTIESEHHREQARLVTIEDSISAEYEEIVATRDRCRTELEQVGNRLPEYREQRDCAVADRAEAQAAAAVAAAERGRAVQACDETRLGLLAALATPGVLDALSPLDRTPSISVVAESVGHDGLRRVLDDVEGLLAGADSHIASGIDSPVEEAGAAPDSRINPDRGRPVGRGRAPSGPPDTARITADSVRQSLRRRRDALGAGWDAEERQPDPALPLVVEVTGPSGKAPLAASARAVSDQRDQMAALLDHKQSEALRELLQGLIAREIAERVHGAARLVERMNERLGTVSTAHDVGVRLRWRRAGELDPATNSMIDLLTKLPDLRNEDDESELRRALSHHLQEARALHPDVPYRQLISETLDYKQWHEMAVMVRRPGEKEVRLRRNTPLSEGEKKLVTYLPLFAAVAASCDSLTEQANAADDGQGVTRFVVLDDAFAKVSEDNHAKLFGLLVDLDLDLIATSERLWGTHATVPEMAITEVVRDARLGAILLEHYRWDGAALQRLPVP